MAKELDSVKSELSKDSLEGMVEQRKCTTDTREEPMIYPHSSTTNQRAHWVSTLIAQEGSYGVVSQLSRLPRFRDKRYIVGKRKDKAHWKPLLRRKSHARDEAVAGTSRLNITGGRARQLSGHPSLSGLLGQEVSLGTITAIVQRAGQHAQSWLEQQVPGEERVLALDEQYSSKRGEAYLNVVDVHSSQVWASLPPVAVDGESWTLALWYLHEQGVVCKGSVSDGGKAIHEALRTTKAISTHQRDVWHLLHLAGQVQARLEGVVQEEEERGRLIERQEQQRGAQARKRSSSQDDQQRKSTS